MLKKVDRIFGWLMVLGSCGHTLGTFKAYPFMSAIFVWSLGTSLAGFLLGTLNIVRAGRPQDKTMAAIVAVGLIGWILVAWGFGKTIDNLLDPRVVGNAAIAAFLLIFSLMTLRHEG
jgi:hypothetical protein